MIGRQHRGEGADLMSYAGWDALDVEDCLCKLLRRLLQMKSSVSRVLCGDEPGKVEVLYLATLSRRPTAEELARSVVYVERGGPTLDPKKALADVLWSLINSAEFVLNH